MMAYEIYRRDQHGEEQLVGILPERRKNTARITKESVLRWGKLVLADRSGSNANNLFFKTVEL